MRLLAYAPGSVNQELLVRNEYLAAENRILRTKLTARPRIRGTLGSLSQTGVPVQIDSVR